jgi:hypothetical protein
MSKIKFTSIEHLKTCVRLLANKLYGRATYDETAGSLTGAEFSSSHTSMFKDDSQPRPDQVLIFCAGAGRNGLELGKMLVDTPTNSDWSQVATDHPYKSIPIYNTDDLLPYITGTLPTTEKTGTAMASMKSTAEKAITTNKDAAMLAARITVGRAANKVVCDSITPKLPLMTRGVMATKFGPLIAANVATIAVDHFMCDNTKANVITKSMVEAAMLDIVAEFDIEGMIENMLDQVKGTSVNKLVAAAKENVEPID